MRRAILPTGNCNPALVLRETAFLPTALPRDIFTWLQQIHTVRSHHRIVITTMRNFSKQHNLQNLEKFRQSLADIDTERRKHWKEAHQKRTEKLESTGYEIEGWNDGRKLQQSERNWSRADWMWSDAGCAASYLNLVCSRSFAANKRRVTRIELINRPISLDQR